MGMFKNMLKDDESLFLNPEFLDFDYQPKIVLFREGQQKYIGECIKPLLSGRSGRNILVSGTPGVGKSLCLRHVLKELEEDFGDDIHCLYLNCWQKDSAYKIISSLCEQIGYKWTNKKVDELMRAFCELANKKKCVIVFDEADKIEEQGIIYNLIEGVYKNCMIFITNDSDFMINLDMRIKSRLGLAILEFEKYKMDEVFEILRQRRDYVFVNGIWEEEAFELICLKTYERGDIRRGLQMMKECGESAEIKASRRILMEHCKNAVEKLKSAEADDDEMIYKVICENSGKSMGDVYKTYELFGGRKSYRTFQRKIKNFADDGRILLKEKEMGFHGRTRVIEKI